MTLALMLRYCKINKHIVLGNDAEIIQALNKRMDR